MVESKAGFKAVFSLEKGTKNTWKYEEHPESGQPPRIGSLYIQKWALGGEKPPQTIRLTLEAGSNA